jgi:Meckel syndrome type 1 protein
MPPLRSPSDFSAGWLGSTSALPGPLRTRPTLRPLQPLHLAVLALQPILIAACAPLAHAQTAAVGDRYSGEVYVQPAYRQAAASGPTLSWPGKSAASAPQFAAPSPSAGFGEQMRAPAYAYAAQAYRPAPPAIYQTPVTPEVAQSPAYQTPAYQTSAYQPPAYPAQVARAPAPQPRAYAAPPVAPWYQRYGTAAASSAPTPSTPQAGAPQSIYDPPAGQGGAARGASSAVANPTPAPAAANDGETARFYSLHRQYGLTPDPDPIPPQFFTQTADLSDPPGPSPVYKAATSSGGSTTAVHTVQSDDSASPLGQP